MGDHPVSKLCVYLCSTEVNRKFVTEKHWVVAYRHHQRKGTLETLVRDRLLACLLEYVDW